MKEQQDGNSKMTRKELERTVRLCYEEDLNSLLHLRHLLDMLCSHQTTCIEIEAHWAKKGFCDVGVGNWEKNGWREYSWYQLDTIKIRFWVAVQSISSSDKLHEPLYNVGNPSCNLYNESETVVKLTRFKPRVENPIKVGMWGIFETVPHH